jgi:hypothetical protein
MNDRSQRVRKRLRVLAGVAMAALACLFALSALGLLIALALASFQGGRGAAA